MRNSNNISHTKQAKYGNLPKNNQHKTSNNDSILNNRYTFVRAESATITPYLQCQSISNTVMHSERKSLYPDSIKSGSNGFKLNIHTGDPP